MNKEYSSKIDEFAAAQIEILTRKGRCFLGLQEEIAREIAVMTMEHVIDRAELPESEDGASKWTFGVYRNTCLNYMRKWFAKTNLSLAEYHEESNAYYVAELHDFLSVAIKNLDPILADVIRLHYFEQFSYEEIGEMLEINPAAARKRASRALQALRVTIEQLQTQQ